MPINVQLGRSQEEVDYIMKQGYRKKFMKMGIRTAEENIDNEGKKAEDYRIRVGHARYGSTCFVYCLKRQTSSQDGTTNPTNNFAYAYFIGASGPEARMVKKLFRDAFKK
jgi:hypothetical protein